jgi:tetratricopeptide (TPR) repeat protein
MTTKNATGQVTHKLPVAFFIAAAGLLVYGVISNATRGNAMSLPEPTQMALVGGDRIDTVDTVDLWQKRVDAHPDSATFKVKLAGSMLTLAGETGDLSLYPRAEAVARAAVDEDPTNESTQLTLASALAGQHDFGDALDLANSVLQQKPGSVAATIAAADAQLELGDYAAAEAAYADLAARYPGEPSIESRSAHLAALTGNLDGAVELARKALIAAGEKDFNTFTGAFYWFQLGNYQYQSGIYDEAATTLRSALELEPRHLGSVELLARVETARGNYDEAIAIYETLLERSDAADLRGELAKLYAHKGRADDAALQITTAISLAHEAAGEYPAERRHLIGFLADADPQSAVVLARQDLALRSDVQTYGWLAWTLLQTGHADEALQYVGPALRMHTQDAWLLYQTGSVYAAVGDAERARPLLTEALALNPEFDLVHAERARQLIESMTEK